MKHYTAFQKKVNTSVIDVTIRKLHLSSVESVRHDPQPDLPTLAPNGADIRRTIVGIGTMSASAVRSTTRRISVIGVLFAFFPRALRVKQLIGFRLVVG